MSGLVLTRREGEAILIGDDIRITVRQIGHSDVRIQVIAPKGIRVDREEVRERIAAEGKR